MPKFPKFLTKKGHPHGHGHPGQAHHQQAKIDRNIGKIRNHNKQLFNDQQLLELYCNPDINYRKKRIEKQRYEYKAKATPKKQSQNSSNTHAHVYNVTQPHEAVIHMHNGILTTGNFCLKLLTKFEKVPTGVENVENKVPSRQ